MKKSTEEQQIFNNHILELTKQPETFINELKQETIKVFGKEKGTLNIFSYFLDADYLDKKLEEIVFDVSISLENGVQILSQITYLDYLKETGSQNQALIECILKDNYKKLLA